MPKFTRLEVWSDVACNGGTRLAAYPVGTLLACQATFALDGNEQLTFAVPGRRIDEEFEAVRLTEDDNIRITEDSLIRVTEASMSAVAQDTYLTRGKVVRVCTESATAFDEWRIRDVEEDAQAGTVGVLCDSIGLDLARALYTSFDGTGSPVTEFSAVQIDAEGLVDGPIRDALDDAGLTYIVKGTIEPTGTFDADADWASARTLALQAIERGGGELRVRRNGTTDYRIDILDEIGSTAPVVYARTARNLLQTQRRTLGALGGTRVVPRGKDDSTSRTVAYAYWEVTDVTGNVLTIRDPRGAGFPSPLPLEDMAVGWTVWRRQNQTPSTTVTASTDGPTAGLSRVTVASASGFSVGMLVEFVADVVSGVPRRLWGFDDPAAQAAQAGVHNRVLDRATLSGVVNFASDPFLRNYTGEARFPFILGNGGQITASTASPTVTGSGTWFTSVVQVGDRVYNSTGPTLLGTVLTVDSATQLTLTANSLANATSVNWTLGKDAPTGAVTDLTQGANVFTFQVDSNVAGITSKAWRIVRPSSRIGTASVRYRLPPIYAPNTVEQPYTYWAWADVQQLTGSATLTFTLRRADTNAVIAGTTVALTPTEENKQVRVLFQSPLPSGTVNGAYIEMQVGVGATGDEYDIILGPQGCQPAGWAITDVETPRACDLWHEGTLWLQTQSLPISYNVDLVDLEQVTGGAVPEAAIALGGTVRVDDRDLGVVSDQRVIQFTRDYLRPGDVSLTLGRKDKTLAEYLAAQSGLSVADVALSLSRGLLSQADRIDGTPIVQATPSAVTAPDTENLRTVSLALRASFSSL